MKLSKAVKSYEGNSAVVTFICETPKCFFCDSHLSSDKPVNIFKTFGIITSDTHALDLQYTTIKPL